MRTLGRLLAFLVIERSLGDKYLASTASPS
jgi:hypothetical protein